MSIGGTLASALSGLTASAKAAELVSSNIANATTPGYARRELQLGSRVVGSSGQGVQVVGVYRNVNLPLLGDRRLAQASSGDADARAAFFQRFETTLGTPDKAFSINGRVAAFDAALTEATSHPESEPRLTNVLSSAKALAAQLGAASKDVQSARQVANTEIATEVNQLNSALERTVKLNVQIRRNFGLGQDTAALQDQRQQLIDQISKIVPVREIQQNDGSVALYTPNGAVLLDGVAAVFGFSGGTTVTPSLTLGAGLAGLTLNGYPIATAGSHSMILGGTLGANFAVRDELGVAAQTQIDAVARDLVERFADPALDASRAPGDPGLFSDAGAAFDPLNEVGLSQRLKINAAADPDQGGALWRLRDGLGAPAAGPVGDSSLLTSLKAALNAPRDPATGGFMAGERSFSGFASDLLSSAATSHLQADGDAAYHKTKLDSFVLMEAESGVDTDQEMQSLLQVEKAYAANAKVIKTVQDMIQTLLDI
ncbi:MAG: flagellar hook-associated protein FlgK [bacterium]